MADLKLDIARMVMQTRYEMQLEREASSVRGGELSDMDRENYQKRIDDLLNAVSSLLDANNAMGEIIQQLENIADEYDARTARGKIPLSIDIDKITIIGALRTYSSNKYISIIKWASLEEVVRIKNVECTYTLYSPYGEPLAADVTVTFSVADDYQFGTSFLKASVRTKSLIDRGLVATSLSANYASSEFIPSIVSNARKQESQYEE